MRQLKVFGISAVLVALILGGTSCSGYEDPGGSPATDENAGSNSEDLYERSIILTDGREVTCVVFIGTRKGGLSCDWDNAQYAGAE